MPGEKLPRATLVTLVLIPLALTACGSEQDALHPHSRAARGIASLWWDMLIGAGLALSIVALVLLLALNGLAIWLRDRFEARW